ncbi:MAG: acyl-CoA synthetase [Thauera sp.]|nr:acyl-CoA synthetase [Thauera sp.]
MSESAHWREHGERSTPAILRLMVNISLRCGRGPSRLLLRLITAYFLLFAPRARRASRTYLRRIAGQASGWLANYRHLLCFASTIHDRIYLLADRFELFDIEIDGAEALQAALARQPGALLVGAHFGSFEVLRAMARQQQGLQVAMLMYEDNARKIAATLHAVRPQASADIIALGQPDSMLIAHQRLEEGHLVGMLADRDLGQGPRLSCDFLGKPASFPLGPWRVAAMLKRPVFFMAGIHLGGRRYRLQFRLLADFSQVSRSERSAAIEAAVAAYAAQLEQNCRQHPYNWFNFFDFWHQ